VIIWGLFARAAPRDAVAVALAILAVNVFWNFAYAAQSTTNMQINEDLWSGSIRQVLMTGVTGGEYIAARIVFALMMSVPVGAVLMAVAWGFGFTVHGMYLASAASIAITTLASVGLAVLVAAAVFTLGKEYSFLAWTVIQIFVMLSAPFYAPEALPAWMEYVSRAMPFTDAFAVARLVAAGAPVEGILLRRGFLVAGLYVAVSMPLYLLAFRRARVTGMLARL